MKRGRQSRSIRTSEPHRPSEIPSKGRGPTRGASPLGGAIAASTQWAVLNDEWHVSGGSFESPRKQRSASQMVIFGKSMKDGTISSKITLVKSLGDRWQGLGALEANLIFRYASPEQHYYAGTGAWGSKFHISKALPGPSFVRLNSIGSAESLDFGRAYNLRIECQATKLVLFENDTKLLEAIDDDYVTGRWGLHSWKTQARFDPQEPHLSPVHCFVVMPFAPAFDGVYDIIREVVESYGNVTCTRADQLTVSRPIMEDVRNEIARADLVIVDLTGRNPNVYYEAGMAAAWKKDWIVIAQSNDDLTFDVEQIRTILYANRIGGADALRVRLRAAIESTLVPLGK